MRLILQERGGYIRRVMRWFRHIAASSCLRTCRRAGLAVLTALPHSGQARIHSNPILIIASGHASSPIEQDQIRGIASVLPPDTEILVEYLDARFINHRRHFFNYYETLLYQKYHPRHFAAIVALNDDAIRLLHHYRSTLFHYPPLVLGGSCREMVEALDGLDRWTGVFSQPDLVATLRMAVTLHPQVRSLCFLSDQSSWGRRERAALQQALNARQVPVRIIHPDPEVHGTYSKLFSFVNALPQNSLLFFANYDRDMAGNRITPHHLVSQLSAEAPVPIYSDKRETIGHGVVGGHVLDGYLIGRTVGHMLQRILAGEPPEDIPPVRLPGVWLFDHHQLVRWNIPARHLPAGSQILNKPVGFFMRHRSVLLTSAAIIGTQSVIIGLLLWFRRRRIVAESALSLIVKRYQFLFEHTKDLTSILDCHGRVIQANDEMVHRFNAPAQPVVGRAWISLIAPDDRDKVQRQLAHLQKMDTLTVQSYYHTADGQNIPVELLFHAFTYESTPSVLCIGRDLTGQLAAQRMAWKVREREQTRIGQELHDGLCQDLKSIEYEWTRLERILPADRPVIREELTSLRERLNRATRQAHGISRNLLPLGLENIGMPVALRRMGAAFAHPDGPALDLDIDDTLDLGDPEHRLHMYRIAQEGIQNAVRHAAATRIQLRWTRDAGGQIILSICDNGRGIDELSLESGGLGIHVMRSRALAIGAILNIKPRPEGGTEVVCTSPRLLARPPEGHRSRYE